MKYILYLLFVFLSPCASYAQLQDLTLTTTTSGLAEAFNSITLETGFESASEFGALIVSLDGGVPAPFNTSGSYDANRNWILNKTYDDNGNVVGERKVFFDNAGRPVQTQNKIRYRKDENIVYTHVFANQTIRDAYGRDVLTTLSAPIDNSEFAYKADFVLNASGTTYNYKNFDRFNPSGTETDKTNNPDVIGSQNKRGTLGWYYSSYNIWEPYTATTTYPYNRQAVYRDGTGNVRKDAGVGEQLKMGSGHEIGAFTTPVINELSHYFQFRNTYFTSSEMGNVPTNLVANASQTVSVDPNGRMVVNIMDGEGRVLVSARPGTEWTPSTNSVTLSAMPYKVVLPTAYSGGSSCGSLGTQFIKISGAGSYFRIKNLSNYIINRSGPLSNFEQVISPGDWGSTITSDAPFKVTYIDKQVSGCLSNETTINSNQPNYNTKNICYFAILSDNTNVNITGGSYTIYDMLAESPTALLSGNKLNKGYYKLVATDGDVTLVYGNKYSDLTYYFYNQLGQLIATLSPEGVKHILEYGLYYYYNKEEVPYIKFYYYDAQGRMMNNTIFSALSDIAISNVYRGDGKIRFSQNADQRSAGKFSYTNYDALGRPIESGEYQPDGNGIVFNSDLTATTNPMRDVLENTSSTGGLTTGTKRDVVFTFYDLVDATHGQSGYIQDAYYLRNAVSKTMKYSNVINNTPNGNDLISTTWYNYDDEGKVSWVIKYINGFGYKTTDYTYNTLGQLTQRVHQKNNSAETFVHYYEYDPVNLQLWKVYTNTVDNVSTKTLQAKYKYYLHGPLKRIELATDLQGIDYTYTLQGALKSINNSNSAADPGNDGNGVKTDAFGMVLDYFPGDYSNNRTVGIQPIKGVNTSSIVPGESYAGNIKAISWFSKKPSSVLAGNPNAEHPTVYIFNYDNKYQFQECTWGNGLNFGTTPASFTSTAFNKETIKHPTNSSLPAYDNNGNILYLQRTNASGTLVDKFTYSYSDQYYKYDRLKSISNDYNGTPQLYMNYGYNYMGQLTNGNRIRYDVTGKVTSVSLDNNLAQKVAEYVYDELGQRIIKRDYNSSHQLIQNTYYVGDVIYTQAVSGGSPGAIVPQEYELDGGIGRIGVFYRPSATYAYELKDYLGNVRAVVAKNASNLEVRMYTDYYPFGMVSQQGGTNDYRYDYQGQYSEKDKETGWNAFELRMYDSRIGRWLQPDPAEQYPSLYAGMGNDPVKNIDPRGDIVQVEGNFWFKLKTYASIAVGWTFSSSFRSMFNELNRSDYIHIIKKGDGYASSTIARNQIAATYEGLIFDVQNDDRLDINDPSKGFDRYTGTGKGSGSIIFWSLKRKTGADINGNTDAPSFITLFHELVHSKQINDGKYWSPRYDLMHRIEADPNEIKAVFGENLFRAQITKYGLGLWNIPLRRMYGNTDVLFEGYDYIHNRSF